LAQNDANALQKRSPRTHTRIGPAFSRTGKPAPSAALADKWSRTSGILGNTYPWGTNVTVDRLGAGPNGEFVDFGPWLHALENAYEQARSQVRAGDPG